jgi:hypothetical protein
MQPGKIHSEHHRDILKGFSASSVLVYDILIQKTIDQQLLARLGNRSVDPQEAIAWRVPFLYKLQGVPVRVILILPQALSRRRS